MAIAALAFLAVMALSGRMRESQQYVKYEPAGLMREPPEDIDRIELVASPRRRVFTRTAGSWTLAPAPGDMSMAPHPTSSDLSAHLEMSLRFMHATAPVRIMMRSEYADEPLRDYGLDPPGYSVTLHQGPRTVMSARFGAPTPQTVLQYVQVDGRDELYLLPVFVGREWELVAAGTPP